jgi:acyl dehydratase
MAERSGAPEAASWAARQRIDWSMDHADEAPMRRLIDLSHTIEHGMLTYKGLPAPLICDFLSRDASRKLYSAGTEFHIGRIDMVANTGTYVARFIATPMARTSPVCPSNRWPISIASWRRWRRPVPGRSPSCP